jgi:GxxExxY protein
LKAGRDIGDQNAGEDCGTGLIKSVYEEAMVEELTQRGLQVQRQLQVPIVYKGKFPA